VPNAGDNRPNPLPVFRIDDQRDRVRFGDGFLGVYADGESLSCMPVMTFARDRLPDAASLS